MRTLSDFRSHYAVAFDLNASSWRVYQSALAPVLGMRARPTDDRVQIDTSPGFTVSPPASAEDCGLLVTAGLLKGSVPTLAHRTLLRWHARAVEDGTYFHQAIVNLLLLPEIAEELVRIEMVREFCATRLVWRDGRQFNFETTDVYDLAKRIETTSNGYLHSVATLGGEVIRDMVAWLGAEPETVSRRAALITR